jgi:hypothetical protein
VIVLALGLPQMFASIDHGDALDNGAMVARYVLVRVALAFLWWQVARRDPLRRPAAHAYIGTIGVAQAGWVVLTIVDLPVRGDVRVVHPAGRARACRPVRRGAKGGHTVASAPHSPSATAYS